MSGPTHAAGVAVTGATGFLGRALVQQLTEAGWQVRALTRQPGRAPLPGVVWVPGDVLDEASLSDLVPDGGVVYHLATTLHGTREVIHNSIVTGTRNVIAAARSRGVRVVHVSSLSVMDPDYTAGAAQCDESGPLDPKPELRGAYAGAKIQAERLVMAARQVGDDIRTVRPAQIVGAGMGAIPPSIAIGAGGLMVALAALNQPLPVVHVEDAAAGLRLVGAAEESPEPVHLVDPAVVTRGELLDVFRRDRVPGAERVVLPAGAIGALATVLLGSVPGREGALRRMLALRAQARWSSDAAAQLGWAPRHLADWLGHR